MSVCFCTAFLGHFETDWETRWHTVAYRPRMSSKTIKFLKVIFRRVIALFYISLRFL